jgi:hypothetical protein
VQRSSESRVRKRRRQTKVEAFGRLGILPSIGREVHKISGGAISPSDQPIDLGPSDFPRPGRSRRSAQEEQI